MKFGWLRTQSFSSKNSRKNSLSRKPSKTSGDISLVIAVAIDVITIAVRTEVYASQVKGYTELTEGNLERLRIAIPETLNFDWQNIYLFVSALKKLPL